MQKIFFCALLLLLCPAIYGQYDDFDKADRTERIINFHSDIIIDTTGVIRVTESIKVYAGGEGIKRGIVRSIPLYRTDKYGKKKKMNTDIVFVFCNGHEEDYKTEDTGEYKEIYIGNPNVYLEPGIYEYAIVYKSAGQVGFFDDYDELYWNVTGNDWEFSIGHASASITLPDKARSITASCYTGSSGSTEMNCSSEKAGNTVNFETHNLLSAHEGFTVAVSFPRDIVKRPPPPTPLELFWEKYKHLLCALICLAIFGCFFYFTWRKVGKDPEKPVAIPTFNPPHGISPAATRYLYKRKYDDKAFTAALVGMAVKGAVRITDKDRQYTMEAIEKKDNLSGEEKGIYDALFPDSKSITVTNTNHRIFAKTNLNLTNSLQVNWDLKNYFLENLKYVAFGAVLTLALIILYIIIVGYTILEGSIFFTAPFIGLAAMFMAMKKNIKGCLISLIKFSGLAFFGLLSFVSSFSALMSAAVLSKENWMTGAFVLGLLILYGIYVYLIKAPTKLGAQTAAELEGFKMYLATAEEHRLNLLTPPERTPELFEKLLPYAIALDVENEWGKKFTDVLKQFNYNPDWYDSSKPFSSSGFPLTFARSFTSSVSSAGINPVSTVSSSSSSGGSWSSGSSGGGFSGGGGGGGGGRGW